MRPMESVPRPRTALYLLAALWLLLIGAFLGAWFSRSMFEVLPSEKAKMFREVFREVEENYVFEPNADELAEGAMMGLVAGLQDRYSQYVPPRDADEFEAHSTGQYQGIGILMARDTFPVAVLYPFHDSPAERAGLQVGDRILAVDGVAIPEQPSRELIESMRERLLGQPGRAVELRIARGERDDLDFTVVRGPVQQPSVQWDRLVEGHPNLGYVHVNQFQNNTTHELRAAIDRLTARAKALDGLIVDLRDNTGGHLDECVDLCSLFLESGTILTTRGRGGIELDTFSAKGGAPFADLPLVLLVNGQSASASEVMAGALHDHDRATLVGTRTFGKGVVQTVYRWEDFDCRLKLTTAHYYTPNGVNIEGTMRAPDDPGEGGIGPDVEVPVADELGERISRALAEREPPPRYRDAATAFAKELGEPLSRPLGADQDPQLRAAIDQLVIQVRAASPTRPPENG